jgi:phosphatidylglycerophosphate synthase
VIFALAMVPWVAYAAVRRWRGAGVGSGDRAAPAAPAGRRGALALLAAVAASLLVVAVYLASYERPAWIPPNPGKRDSVLTAAKFVAMAFGPAVRDHWEAWILVAALVLAPTALVLVLEAVHAWRAAGPERERARTLGLVCFAGGTAVLTLAMGYGRAAYVPSIGMPTRYVLLAAPALVAAYLVWELYGTPTLRRTVQAGLLVLLIALLPANTRVGLGWRDWYVAGMTAVERDVAAGVPRRELAHRNYPFLLHWNEALCADAIGWLRDAGRGPFARVAERPR